MGSEKKFSVFIGLILLAVVAAVIWPETFVGLKPYIPALLGLIMFSIGLTLQSAEFKQVYRLKWQIVGLIILKYTVLPMVALILVRLLHLSNTDLIGLILVSAAPGGTSAAIMSFLARANVALTVVLTFVTTLLAPLIMPTIMYIMFHKSIVIPVQAMASSIFWIVLFPLCDGLILRRILGESRIGKVQGVIPWVSIVAVALIVSCVMALNHERILTMSGRALLVVLLDNLAGVIIGYLVARKLFRLDSKSAQSVGFEYGWQDSGLAVVLASKFFGVATALCGALYSVVQNITGPLVVKFILSRSQDGADRGKLTCSKANRDNLV